MFRSFPYFFHLQYEDCVKGKPFCLETAEETLLQEDFGKKYAYVNWLDKKGIPV